MVRGKGYHPKGEENPLWKGGKLETARRYLRTEHGRLKDRTSNKVWYQNNRGRQYGYHQTARLKLKRDVLGHYSNGKLACICCGFDDLDCLSIDHINGGGNQHRKEPGIGFGMKLYYWLRKNEFPEGYQTLCMNCQFKKKMVSREQPRYNKGSIKEV